jgi:hypothetical protein
LGEVREIIHTTTTKTKSTSYSGLPALEPTPGIVGAALKTGSRLPSVDDRNDPNCGRNRATKRRLSEPRQVDGIPGSGVGSRRGSMENFQ